MSTLRLLLILLGVQLALAVVTWWPQDPAAGRLRPLLDLPADGITSVAIAIAPEPGGDPSWLELERRADGWRVASEQGYPANPTAVTQLLDRLLSLRVGPPIATRAATHNALNVGDEDYGRRVRIGTADGEIELVVSAARSKSVNVRLTDSEDVYVADGISEWSLQETPDGYWVADYVKVDPGMIHELHVHNPAGELQALRGADGWTISDLDEGQVTDSDGLDEWLREVATLRLLRPVSADASALPSGEPTARISWTIEAENESVGGGYALYRIGEDRVLAKSDNHPFVVEVSASRIEPLLEVTRADVVRDIPAEAAALGDE